MDDFLCRLMYGPMCVLWNKEGLRGAFRKKNQYWSQRVKSVQIRLDRLDSAPILRINLWPEVLNCNCCNNQSARYNLYDIVSASADPFARLGSRIAKCKSIEIQRREKRAIGR